MQIRKVEISRIVSCFDGDTFRCDIDTWPKLFGWKIPVRICGVNCPERNVPDPATQARAAAAKKYTSDALTNGRRILLLNVKRGKYFRLIADVEIDGHDLGTALIREGLADPIKRS